jgi:hypothetical protein
MLTLKSKFGSIPASAVFWTNLRMIDINPLNVW